MNGYGLAVTPKLNDDDILELRIRSVAIDDRPKLLRIGVFHAITDAIVVLSYDCLRARVTTPELIAARLPLNESAKRSMISVERLTRWFLAARLSWRCSCSGSRSTIVHGCGKR